MNFIKHNFGRRTFLVNIPNLQSLMEKIDVHFACKIITNSIDCLELLFKFEPYFLKLLKHNTYIFTGMMM